MRRRGFITVLAAAAAWPLAGHAQPRERVRRIGVLKGFAENDPSVEESMNAFARALESLGWVEGENLRIDYRFVAGDPTLSKTYAAELVGLAPDAILAIAIPAIAAMQQQTRMMPIVFTNGGDPIELGFVQSLARPGGNITGFSGFDPALTRKWLQLLKDVAPSVTRVTGMFNPDTPPSLSRELDAAAQSLRMTVTRAPVLDDAGIEEAIATLGREPGGGLMILPGV